MPVDAACDVAQTLLFDDARQADAWASTSGADGPSHVEQLREALFATTDDSDDDENEGGDADVIVLAEYSPRELAKELGLQVP